MELGRRGGGGGTGGLWLGVVHSGWERILNMNVGLFNIEALNSYFSLDFISQVDLVPEAAAPLDQGIFPDRGRRKSLLAGQHASSPPDPDSSLPSHSTSQPSLRSWPLFFV